MSFSHADALAAARSSLARAGAHDRAGWLDLFAPSARIEDPVGSRAHRGRDEIDRFYRTFIAHRDITAHVRHDLVAGATVVRDVTLEVAMSASVTMRIPAYLRYDLDPADLRIHRLQAFWELPAMVGQFLRAGPGAAPAGLRLSAALLRHQGPRGAAGFLGGFRGAGRRGRRAFAGFLADASGTDEVAVRRRSGSRLSITDGTGAPMSRAVLLDRLAATTVDKIVVAGHRGAATVVRDDGHAVVIARLAAGSAAVEALRWYAEPRG